MNPILTNKDISNQTFNMQFIKNPTQPQLALTDRQCRAQIKMERLSKFCTLLFFVLLLLVSLGVIFWGLLFDPASIENGMAIARPYLACWRFLLCLLLIGGWHNWINRLAIWSELDANLIRLLHDYRWRMAGWLFLIETLLVQNILAELLE